MMSEAIKKFAEQLSYQPQIENIDKLGDYKYYIVAGMGGSHLAADLVRMWDPTISLLVHSDYGLPNIPDEQRAHTLVIASSYSGNTEETIDAFYEAQKQSLSVACLAVGGKLLEMANEYGVPYVQLPDTGIQPRSALGFSARALLKLLKREDMLKRMEELAPVLKPEEYETAGREIASLLKDHVPVIYSSRRNEPIAYNWKIKFNETGKIPAFYNVLPELNHNEMTGFDVKETSSHLSKPFYFVFLRDDADHPRVQRRMEILEKLYTDRGLPVETIDISDMNPFQNTFSALLLADWAALATAGMNGLESEQVPMVEEFKKLMV